MSIWILSFLGGLVGTLAMDIGARHLGGAGVNDALGGLLGRWVLGFRHGKFNINGLKELNTPETLVEARTGVFFHYIVGGGCVALVYPGWFWLTGFSLPENHIPAGLLFGLISVSLTWFVQYPCFGFSWFGLKGPAGSTTIWPPLVLHSVYGLIMGAVIEGGNALTGII